MTSTDRPAGWRHRLAALSLSWRDILIGAAFMAIMAVACFLGSVLVAPAINTLDAFDIWFDSDPPRVFDNMVSRFSDHKRADVHPFFALLGFVPVFLLRSIAGFDNLTAVRIVLAAVGAVWIVLVYALLRLIGLHRLHAIVFTLLAATSSAALFWLIIPETKSFDSVSILAAFLFIVIAARRVLSPRWAVAMNLLTLSVTVSNWAIGLMATAVTYRKRQVIRVFAYTVCLAVILSAFQLYFFPRAAPFGVSSRILAEEPHAFFRGDAGTPFDAIKAFFVHSVVMPEIQRSDHYWSWSKWSMMRVQLSAIGSGTFWGPVSVAIWCTLLGLGVWALWTVSALPSLRLVLVAAILGQLGLHSVFGREVFVYALHFGPLLVVVAAFGALTRFRHVAVSLAAVLAIVAGINNFVLLRGALAFVRDARPAAAPLRTTTDISILGYEAPSPQASIVLSNPSGEVIGSVRPGGSFIVGAGGFLVSLWVVNDDDVVVTSDTHWSPITSQSVSWPPQGAPFVDTANWYYRVRVRGPEPGRWIADISQMENLISRLALTIRSAPDSGSPIRALAWDGDRLIVNNRWTILVTPAPAAVQVGEEQAPGRFESRTPAWESAEGVGYALFELDRRTRSWRVAITDGEVGSRASR